MYYLNDTNILQTTSLTDFNLDHSCSLSQIWRYNRTDKAMLTVSIECNDGTNETRDISIHLNSTAANE